MRKVSTEGKGGYLIEYAPWHPNCKPNGYVYQHRLIMERKIGRLLKSEECIHHISGDKQDNKIENLELTTKRDHFITHDIQPAGYTKRNYDLLKFNCLKCDKEIFVYEGVARKSTPKYCSNKCRGIAQRRCERPAREILERMMRNMSFVAIGKLFGVSDQAVRKWARGYRIDFSVAKYYKNGNNKRALVECSTQSA